MGHSYFYLLTLLGFELNHSIIKSILIRYRIDNNPNSKMFFLEELARRILLVFQLLLFPFKIVSKTSKKDNYFILEPYASISERELFIKNIRKNNFECIFINGKKSVAYNLNKREILKIWIIFLKVSFFNLFSKANNDTKYLWPLFNFLLINKRNKSSEVYIFRPYTLTSYVTALVLPHLYSVQNINLSSSNTSLFPRRYTYLPNTNLIYCSLFQKEEIKSFTQKKWMQIGSTEYFDSEDILSKKQIRIVPFEYDIGIYSSGFWARRDGYDRIHNSNELKKQLNKNIEFQLQFEKIITSIGELSQMINKKVKCYFHPYEKEIFSKYNLSPPYILLLEKFNIHYDLENQGSSIINIHESKIGVSLFSTIISDRWNESLEGIMYIENHSLEVISKKHLGFYKENIVHSLEDLNKLLLKKLK